MYSDFNITKSANEQGIAIIFLQFVGYSVSFRRFKEGSIFVNSELLAILT